jgi:signal transduction histidine kinase
VSVTRRAVWAGLALGLPLIDVAFLPRWPWLTVLALALALIGGRGQGRLLRVIILLPLAFDLTARVHIAVVSYNSPYDTPTMSPPQFAAQLQERLDRLTADLTTAAEQAAALPQVRALPGRTSRRDLFVTLEREERALESRLGQDLALAVYAESAEPVAWTSRAVDVPSEAAVPQRVFVVSGDTSASLVVRVRLDGGGSLTASLPLLAPGIGSAPTDFLLSGWEGAEVRARYLDARFPVAPDHAPGFLLTGPGGKPFATLTIQRTPRPPAQTLWRHYRSWGIDVVLVLAALLLLMLLPPWRATGLVLGATWTRLVLWILSVPIPSRGGWWPFAGLDVGDLIGPLAGTPAQLALTAAWLVVIALVLAHHAVRGASTRSGPLRAITADILTTLLVAATIYTVVSILGRVPLDLDSAGGPLDPRSTVTRTAFLLVALAGMVLASLPQLRLALSARQLAWRVPAVASVCAAVLWSTGHWHAATWGLMVVPVACLQCLSLHRAHQPPWGRAWLLTLGPVVTIAALGAWLHPLVTSRAEHVLRARIQGTYAPMVRDQPRWSEEVLRRSIAQVDAALSQATLGARHNADEYAYGLWKSTDLATFRFSSAIELRDPSGRIVGRFASHLPAAVVDLPPLAPKQTTWQIERESQPGTSGDEIMRARRLLPGGEGSIEISLLLNHRNLPFVGSDQASLHPTEPEEPLPHRDVALLSYDLHGIPTFSSVEHPPRLEPPLLARAQATPEGSWRLITIEGERQPCFVFRAGDRIQVLAYHRSGLARSLATWADSIGRSALLALAAIVAWITVGSLVRRPSLTWADVSRAVRRRFALRLFLAFVLVALLPVVVVQAVVRELTVERLTQEAQTQALERAAVARKAIEDFARFRSGEAPGREPVTDAVLVWIGQLVRNPVDVFAGARLAASSQRELYASGFLSTRMDGTIYRTLTLDGSPYAFTSQRLGGLSYDVVAVPVRLSLTRTGTASLPLTSRGQERRRVLSDLDRTMRLVLMAFLTLAAVLALSLSRTISRPVAALTRATQRLASGEVGVRVDARTQDELRELVGSFNQMADDLERQRVALERTHREAAWAEMARQVAHEIKNPLTPIQLSAEHLRRVWNDPGVDHEETVDVCTRTILRQVRSLRAIVTEFTAYARPVQEPPVPTDVADLLAAATQPYRAVLPPGLTLTIDAQPGLRVAADRRLLGRAIVNLIENAMQAMEGHGSVQVSASLDETGRECRIEVRDTGPGIPTDVRPRLFEPFFSTKSSGSGLGLSISRRIVEQHGGTITIESAPEHGTRVSVRLPIVVDAANPLA